MTDTRPSSTVVSLAIHAGFVALLLLASKRMMPPGRPDLSSAMPLIAPLLPRDEASIKGGGGMHQDKPASAGHLPRIVPGSLCRRRRRSSIRTRSSRWR